MINSWGEEGAARYAERLLVYQHTVVSHLSCLMTKPVKWHVRPAKTQISLGIRPVWSEPSLSAWRKLGSLATHWGHSKDTDQTRLMLRLIWVFAGRTVILLVMRWLILLLFLTMPEEGSDLWLGHSWRSCHCLLTNHMSLVTRKPVQGLRLGETQTGLLSYRD